MDRRLEDILLGVSMCAEIDKGDINDSVRIILESVMEGLNIKRAGIWLLVDNGKGISCKLVIDTYHDTEIEELVLYRENFPKYFKALDSERAIKANDAKTHEATSEFAESYLKPNGIASMLDVPIRHSGEMVGIICCEHIGEMRQWTNDESSFAAVLADIYSRAISASEKRQYQQQLENLNQELEEKVQLRTQELENKVAELKLTQNSLVESEKMSALGSLVAGVAHEVNTPLGIAITATSLFSEHLNTFHQKYTNNKISRNVMESFFSSAFEVNKITDHNIHRAAELIANFKLIAVDQSSFDLMEINLNDYFYSILANLSPFSKKKNVQFTVECAKEIKITTFPGAIAQIITNLVVNACTHAFDVSNNNTFIIKVDELHESGQLLMSIKDNGFGMKEEERIKAIEPFYTSKRGKGGSGLGLSIVYNLVQQQLKGFFELHSTLGQGTEVIITLPKILSD